MSGDHQVCIAQTTIQGGAPGEVLSTDPLVVAAGSGSLEIVNWEWEDEDDERGLNVGQVLGSA